MTYDCGAHTTHRMAPRAKHTTGRPVGLSVRSRMAPYTWIGSQLSGASLPKASRPIQV